MRRSLHRTFFRPEALNLLLFCHSRYRRRCHYINFLLKYSTNLTHSFFWARKNTGANHTPFSGILLTLRSDTVSERKLWLAIKQWMKLQWKMYNINIFIQDSKSESDWNVSVNLDFYVLCLFFRLFFLAGFWRLWKMDEPLSKSFPNYRYFTPATTTTACSKLMQHLEICLPTDLPTCHFS